MRRSGGGSGRMRRGGPETQAGAAERGSGSTAGRGRERRVPGRRGCVDAAGREGAGRRVGASREGRGGGGARAGPGRGRRGEGGCGRAGSPECLWPGRSGCGYITFPNLLSQGSGQGGWRGGRGGRTSLNWPGNSRGRGPGEMGCCPAPSILMTPGNFSVKPPRLFYSSPKPSPTLSLPSSSPVALPPLPSSPLPSPLRVGSSRGIG